jgi:hypothetical protein
MWLYHCDDDRGDVVVAMKMVLMMLTVGMTKVIRWSRL